MRPAPQNPSRLGGGADAVPTARIRPIVARRTGFQNVPLEPGDVLMSLGTGNVSRAIQTLDGGKYSHAAVWSGSAVIESTTPSVVEWEIEESLERHQRVYVDVYRHRRSQGRRAEIVAGARSFLGRKYGYGELFLLGLLVATSKWLPQRRSQVEFLMQGCKLHQLLHLDRRSATKLVTCSELAARAHLAASLRLRVRVTADGKLDPKLVAAGVVELVEGSKRGASEREDLERQWLVLRRRIGLKLLDLAGDDLVGAALRGPRAASRVVEIGTEWAPNLVTPRQLEKSPDLKFCGRLYVTERPALRSPAW